MEPDALSLARNHTLSGWALLCSRESSKSVFNTVTSRRDDVTLNRLTVAERGEEGGGGGMRKEGRGRKRRGKRRRNHTLQVPSLPGVTRPTATVRHISSSHIAHTLLLQKASPHLVDATVGQACAAASLTLIAHCSFTWLTRRGPLHSHQACSLSGRGRRQGCGEWGCNLSNKRRARPTKANEVSSRSHPASVCRLTMHSRQHPSVQ